MVKIVGINFESVVDGEGVRVVIFFSGCNHHCKGCHNPASHDFNTGKDFDDDIQSRVIEYIKETPFISGVTLSGGDPMYSASEIIPFLKLLKSEIPNTTIWVYSGFTYEEISQEKDMMELLSICDILVDGPFILEQRDVTLSYRGSCNQRVIDVAKSISENSVILLNV